MEQKPTQRQLQQERGYDQLTEPELRKIVANYYGNISLVDDQVGLVLDALERKGLAEDTMIVFISDHGDHLVGDGLLRRRIERQITAAGLDAHFQLTGLVPPDDYTLQDGDVVEISIEGIGRLSNTVTGMNQSI